MTNAKKPIEKARLSFGPAAAPDLEEVVDAAAALLVLDPPLLAELPFDAAAVVCCALDAAAVVDCCPLDTLPLAAAVVELGCTLD